jgi:hypothetical protein
VFSSLFLYAARGQAPWRTPNPVKTPLRVFFIIAAAQPKLAPPLTITVSPLM